MPMTDGGLLDRQVVREHELEHLALASREVA